MATSSDETSQTAPTRPAVSLNIAPSTRPVYSSLLLPEHALSLFLCERTKRIHFVRHAEGLHNVATRDYAQAHPGADANTPIEQRTPGSNRYVDAPLTRRGLQQCAQLRRLIAAERVRNAHVFGVELVVVSPFTRTMQTASAVFGPFDYPGAPHFVVHELCRERSGQYTCDRLRPKKAILADFADQIPNVASSSSSSSSTTTTTTTTTTSISSSTTSSIIHNSSNVDVHTYWHNEDDIHWTPTRESAASVSARGIAFLKWLAARPEREIAVVTHSSFLRHLFHQFGGQVDDEDRGRMQRVAGNCELRSMTLCLHTGACATPTDGADAAENVLSSKL